MTMLASEEVGPRPALELRLPPPDIDLSMYVLAAVDEHLAMLQSVRRALTTSRKIEPGTRWAAAEISVSSALRYADEMTRALRLAAGHRNAADLR
jgi:hypothetical protein